jgi:hypothetical protein
MLASQAHGTVENDAPLLPGALLADDDQRRESDRQGSDKAKHYALLPTQL